MHTRRLMTFVLTTISTLIVAGSAFAQEAAAAESSAPDISPLVFLIGAGLIVALGSYLAVNSRVSKNE